jgi:U4/U6 small nuclear ribonucleoprotein PRP3
VADLRHPQHQYKVDVNAQENRLSGVMLISDDMSVVIVEGGTKSNKRYQKLMQHRINWNQALQDKGDDDDMGEERARVNKCSLVWQGSVAKPAFERFAVHKTRTEAAARKYLEDAGVAYYWDLATNFVED